MPVITAIGEGKIADMIIKTAINNGVEVVKDNEFFNYEKLLSSGSEIPEEVYQVVAKILSYLIRTNRLKQGDSNGKL
ncbi:MAG: hypothetical protein A2355_00680 [Spirochaetes bacterium RIFOXYB1_FULL_32_8]|nr:MAG: hypothetical protein A2355_00680 [Spirochaetes bacterium RIFOXYB1_FULL_32_8]